MKYISQLNGFWNWVRTNEISHLEVDLYLSILDIANASLWKTQFTIPNSSLGRFDKNSLIRARNKLVQYGLLKYFKGKKGQAPVYSIVKLYDTEQREVGYALPCAENSEINPNNDTYIDTNNDTNNDADMIPKQGIYIDKDKDKDKSKKPPVVPQSRDKEKPIKVPFAEFVEMTNDEYASLIARFGESDTKRLIEILDNYKGSTGKKYKSDYRTILSWVVKRLEEDKKKSAAEYEVYEDSYNHDELEELTRKRKG